MFQFFYLKKKQKNQIVQITANFDVIVKNATFRFFLVFLGVKITIETFPQTRLTIPQIIRNLLT